MLILCLSSKNCHNLHRIKIFQCAPWSVDYCGKNKLNSLQMKKTIIVTSKRGSATSTFMLTT